MLRIAYCSPVNPAPSGISDYSEELLPYLGQYGEITLYVEDGLRPTNPALARHLDIQPLRRLEQGHRRKPYDAILYHMGNSPAHAQIWQVAQRVRGVVVLHEFVLHHFMLWYAANVQQGVHHYVREMSERYGEKGSHMAQLMIRGIFTNAAFDFPCCEPVVAAASGLISHNRYTSERVAVLAPSLPQAIVPMGVPLPSLTGRAEARNRLGLPADALILASFGHINAYKRLELVFRSLLDLRGEYPNLRYLLVGSVSPNYDVMGLIARMGLQDTVSVTGYVPRWAFEEYGAAADICLNLRHPTAGETSASLLRLLGSGRPTMVSATGSFAELPPGVTAQVDVGAGERELLVAYCRLLASHPEVASVLGASARAYVAQHHSLDQAARGYLRFLAHLYHWDGMPPHCAEPLWEVAAPSDGESATKWGVGSAAAGKPGHQGNPGPASPPLPSHVASIVASAAQALADIGVTEQDETMLRTVAEQIQGLLPGMTNNPRFD
ncbi:MAG: glycosyltransferase family 4 protein [Chloroflexaceae bacterium]|nr:glycosyltransferase family 4 protein [Chloroflexaceae bacterium]